MAQPNSREDFKEYILRKIGAPVIQINVAEEQVEDRVDEAVSFWRDYHYNGSQLIYLKHEITEADKENGYITLPRDILGISKIFNFDTSISTGGGMFNVQYQVVLNNVQSMSSYVVGNYIIVEAYDIIDPDEFSDVWQDRWLQNYASVLIREQWGLNLTKFTGMQLAGGVSFNGEQILSEARAEREKMEEDAISNLQPLTYNFIG